MGSYMDGILTQNDQFSTKKSLQRSPATDCRTDSVSQILSVGRLGKQTSIPDLGQLRYLIAGCCEPYIRRLDTPVAGRRRLGITNRESKKLRSTGCAWRVRLRCGYRCRREDQSRAGDLPDAQDEFLRLGSARLRSALGAGVVGRQGLPVGAYRTRNQQDHRLRVRSGHSEVLPPRTVRIRPHDETSSRCGRDADRTPRESTELKAVP